MADFFRTTFSNAFSGMKIMNSVYNFTVPKNPIHNILALVEIMAWR